MTGRINDRPTDRPRHKTQQESSVDHSTPYIPKETNQNRMRHRGPGCPCGTQQHPDGTERPLKGDRCGSALHLPFCVANVNKNCLKEHVISTKKKYTKIGENTNAPVQNAQPDALTTPTESPHNLFRFSSEDNKKSTPGRQRSPRARLKY